MGIRSASLVLCLLVLGAFGIAGSASGSQSPGDVPGGAPAAGAPAQADAHPATARDEKRRRPRKRSHRVAKMLWGLVTLPDGRSPIKLYKRLRVDYFQYQLVWSRIAPTRPRKPKNPNDPAYHWSGELDRFVRAAKKAKIRVAFMVKSPPGWANGGKSSAWVPRNRDYANFLTAAARHYRSVNHWMVWGETNRGATFQPLPKGKRTGPRRYAKLLKAAYKALNKVRRRNKVIGGMTFTFGDVTPRAYVRAMKLPNGKPPPLDYFGHNPFSRRKPAPGQRESYPGARDMGDMPRFAREVHRAFRKVKRFRKRGPKLWLSEFTVSSDRSNRAFNFAVSRKQQAAWLRAAFRIARRNRSIFSLGWFNLMDEPPSVSRGLTTGLLTYDGKPKPVFNAYRRIPRCRRCR